MGFDIEYQAATTIDQALEARADRTVTVIAGCTDVFPSSSDTLQQGLLDVTRIDELSGIQQVAGGWRIGAATTWNDIDAAKLPIWFEGLQQAARQVGSIQIQNAGTIGGNICNASPAADGVPPLLALGAQVELRSKRATRLLSLEDFLLGVRKTALKPNEIMTAIMIPPQPDHAVGAFEKLGSRDYLVISICMTSAVIGVDQNGLIDFARVAVGACSPTARRFVKFEGYLIGNAPDEAQILPEHLAPISPIDDIRGSAEYRYEAVAEQCLRAVRRAGGWNG